MYEILPFGSVVRQPECIDGAKKLPAEFIEGTRIHGSSREII